MINPEIIHIGGEHTVTGSCHLIKAHGLNIMIDCGLCQGEDQNYSQHDSYPNPTEINYLFLTHAHIDHIGRLPELINGGFTGDIICSYPTKALLAPMLKDTMRLAGFSEKKQKKILSAIEDQSWGFEYNELFSLKKGIEFKLGRAGHILGSCFFTFVIPSSDSDNKKFTVIFSGDLGNYNTPILCDPDPPDSCDLLVLESTYGDRLHEDRSQRQKQLSAAIDRALSDGGKIFIPAFALGRTQEILYELDRLFDGKPPIPVVVDSPLSLKITTVYNSLSEFWDKEFRELLKSGDHPFDFQRLYSSARWQEHKHLLNMAGPAIIIAGSGMCTGGRILDHLIEGLPNKRNDIFFVGYLAHGTIGRDILKYSKRPNGYVLIGNKRVSIRSALQVLSGYSAHADQKGLVDWVGRMPEKPKMVKLVHGEPKAQKELAKVLESKEHFVKMTG